ncbi:Gfo/Idh/MocA family protein [Promicromonospora thailandica]|uniref:Oxidoreductase family, NAD-binding Rossmann fold n=1 Tax=Promicromonospora thailandica TaxID=765201 RepID=A0A9X2JV08_9MICO|nr:Gfo/Idh/MocA family oxidoreductase [Promicromonospora thailandica]MCP2263613.1 Oxidoreductase family, NAD-binding Rossmann fold [Promicromonospora thailandica]BFF19196.1 Gfo/Idh/MocA family oxidoreductase [Promicromonospora thailandica]
MPEPTPGPTTEPITGPTSAPVPPAGPLPEQRRRYAVVGTGHRASMYVDALIGTHAPDGEIVAWVEPNPVRAAAYEARVAAALGGVRPVYAPDDLEKAIAEQSVDRVIVTSVDRTHADLVTRALRAGADVVVEKPIAAHPDQARQIVDAVAETGRDLVMTFNYRYSPRNSALREVIASGEIGRVLSVHFDWALDTVHGADYFRRWHREKVNNGGLLVHKSSHHFDLVNWWIDGVPERVFATGGRRFYGDDGAHESDYEPTAGERALTGRGVDPWALSVEKNEWLSTLYGPQAQAVDGYVRNRSVFDPGITTEDTLGLVVEYAGGALLTYSLTAHSPWEGYRVVVNGTRGRAELEVTERGSVEFGEDGVAILDPSATEVFERDPVRPTGERLVVQRHWERAEERQIVRGGGGHGGGDALLLADVFAPSADPDPLARAAGYVDGVRASAVGYAGNRSLETGDPVRIEDLTLGI